MGGGARTVKCDDGFQVISKDQGELVSTVQWHLDRAHHRHVSEADVIGMAVHP
jgi:hypothetical protein